MNIVIFSHPEFKGSQSMPKYTRMLEKGLKERNHSVEIWTAKEIFHKIPGPSSLKKWLGYLDQFVIFPLISRINIKRIPSETLFVFSDHALGPWIPLVAKKHPHIIHCHDFMAQRSALGEVPENKVALTGRIYQRWIRNGYRVGRNFVSISQKTQRDLHRFLNASPTFTEVVYNGLNQEFIPGKIPEARQRLEQTLKINLNDGFILHVGGNQFYKNRNGVVEIYLTWRDMRSLKKIPLIMVGPKPTNELKILAEDSEYASDIYFLTNISDEILKICYQAASVFLFPSLDEGFGWPIAEAMASGCPVITTGKPPMSEVGGDCCIYIPPRPSKKLALANWKAASAKKLNQVLDMPSNEFEALRNSGIENAKRFNTKKSIEQIENIYKKVLSTYN